MLKNWLSIVRNQDKRPKNRRGFYRKSFIFFLLSACIPGLIVGLSIFLVNKERVQNDLQQLHRKQLSQTAKSINDEFSNLEMSVAHWAFDPAFGNTLRKLDFVYGYKDIDNLYTTLLIMEGTSPLIHHVELFVNDSKPYLFTKDNYQLLTSAQAKVYQETLKSRKNIYWMKSLKGLETGYHYQNGIELVLKVPGGSMNPFGTLIVFLNENELKQLLETLTPYAGGSTFIYSNDDGWILTDTAARQPTPFEVSLRKAVMRRSGQNQSFMFHWKGITYSVSSGTFSRLHDTWHYVSAAPLSRVVEPEIKLSKLIVFISLIGLLIALVLSWVSSHRLYRPMDRLIHQITGNKSDAAIDSVTDEFLWIEQHWSDMTRSSELLQERMEQQMYQVREGFLLQLAQGYLYALTENELHERMTSYGWKMNNGFIRALMIRLTGFSDSGGRFKPGDEALATFAAANLLDECSRDFTDFFEIINFHDLSIGVLTFSGSERAAQPFMERLEPLCKEFMGAVNQILGLKVTMTISREGTRLKDVPYLFEEAKVGIGYRNPEKTNEIIKLDDALFDNKELQFNYPYTLEKEIIHTIRTGGCDEAVELIERFVEELIAGSEMEGSVHQGMLYLLGSIHHVILQSGLNPYRIYEGANLYEKIPQIENPVKLSKWFGKNVIRPFIENLSEKEDVKSRQLVMQVIEHLQDHFTQDVSLDLYADMFGTSVYNISRSFKLVTGMNFIDYVTDLRLGKAKELLSASNLMINEIAGKIGYQSSYFNRLFKKHEGISPGKYRQLNKQI